MTQLDISITNKEEIEFGSFDTILETTELVESSGQIKELIIEYERILNINEKLQKSEEQIRRIYDTIDEVKADINEKEIKDLNIRSKITSLQEEIEKMIQVNSKMSHEIKKNDISISHMVKNYDGRKAFLNTIEIDINRAESYGKRLQIEFEREYETFDLCQGILSATELKETEVDNKHKGSYSDTTNKTNLSENDEENIDK